MMRTRFGLILKITVWTKSYISLKKRYFAKSPESQAKLSLFSGFHPNYSQLFQTPKSSYPQKQHNTAIKLPLFLGPLPCFYFFLVHRKARNGCSSFRYLHDGGDDSVRHGEYAFCNRRIHVSSLPSATARIAPSPLVRIGFGFKPFLHIRWKCAEEIQSRLSYPLPYIGHSRKSRRKDRGEPQEDRRT